MMQPHLPQREPEKFLPIAARSFAHYAATALATAAPYSSTAELTQQLQQALQSRAVIDQATGIIMAELRCNPDDAFTYLTTLSQGPEPKVLDIAAEIVHRTQQSRRIGLVTTVGGVRPMQLASIEALPRCNGP